MKQCCLLYVHYSCLDLQIKVLTEIKDIHRNEMGKPKLQVITQVTTHLDSAMIFI